MKVVLKWNSTALKDRGRRFKKLQRYVDEQCAKCMIPYVPVALRKYPGSGKLLRSMEIAEPGMIVFNAPRAKHGYYARVNHKHGENPNARRMWFEYMKKKDGWGILCGAAKIVGGKPEK